MTAFPTSPNEQALLRVGVEFPDAGVTRRTTGSEIARGTLRYARVRNRLFPGAETLRNALREQQNQ